jgi:hypothetical protein
MSFEINEYEFDTECKRLAQEALEQTENDQNAAIDLANEYADSHEWVIYHYKALRICVECNVDQGESFLEDIGMPENVTLNSLASLIVYGEMQARISAYIDEIADAMDD